MNSEEVGGQKTVGWKAVLILLCGIVIVESFILYSGAQTSSTNIGLPWGEPQFSDFGSYVGILGSWISDSPDGVITGQQFNTVDLSCDKNAGVCVEARAYKADITRDLLVQKFEYQIKSWGQKEIVAILDARAGTIEIRFDRNKRLVTMIETDKPEIEGARLLPAYAHIGGGPEAMQASRK